MGEIRSTASLQSTKLEYLLERWTDSREEIRVLSEKIDLLSQQSPAAISPIPANVQLVDKMIDSPLSASVMEEFLHLAQVVESELLNDSLAKEGDQMSLWTGELEKEPKKKKSNGKTKKRKKKANKPLSDPLPTSGEKVKKTNQKNQSTDTNRFIKNLKGLTTMPKIFDGSRLPQADVARENMESHKRMPPVVNQLVLGLFLNGIQLVFSFRPGNTEEKSEGDEVPATFCDVAACFSVEERKLLHEWQKELYRNVMKEIHQALSLLGPLIANSVFSLSAGADHEDFEGKHNNLFPGFPCFNVESNLRPDEASSTQFLDQPASRVGENIPRAGQEMNTSVVSCCIKEEGERYSVDQYGSKITKINHNPGADFPLLNDDFCSRKEQEPNTSLVEQVFISQDENSPITGSVVRIRIKDEDSAYFIDHRDAECVDRISGTTDDRTLEKNPQDANPVKYLSKTRPYTTSSVENGKMPLTSQTQAYTRGQLWPSNHRQLETQKSMQSEHGFSNAVDLSVHQRNTSSEGKSCEYPESPNSAGKEMLPKTPLNQIPILCRQNEGTFKHKGEFVTFKRRRRPREKRHTCTHCGKRFCHKGDLNRHQKTHTGEKPYTCIYCYKNIRRKGDLMRHQRTHTGEKPYTCNDCQKSFSRKYVLNEHRRIHLAEGKNTNPMNPLGWKPSS
ncbi:zinc finger protein 25-like [Ambystoma mexicanum]|uniref:zinc finger protein 25-like n=1 Tax=Ambystoma mexicanum TaxID=8296 RepID=UPI0037E8F5DC